MMSSPVRLAVMPAFTFTSVKALPPLSEMLAPLASPLMVMFLVMVSVAARSMVSPDRPAANSMVSPAVALVSVWARLPAPLALVLVTMSMATAVLLGSGQAAAVRRRGATRLAWLGAGSVQNAMRSKRANRSGGRMLARSSNRTVRPTRCRPGVASWASKSGAS